MSAEERIKQLVAEKKVLRDRLAIALMAHTEIMQIVCLARSRADDREMLREDPVYADMVTAINNMLRDGLARA